MSDPKAEAVFAPPRGPSAAVEYIVNFGMVAGRDASRHELERLGQALLEHVESASITSETRLELGTHAAGIVHQVRVEIGAARTPKADTGLEGLRQRVGRTIERWLAASVSGVSGEELEEAELDARDAVVEIVHGELYPGPPQATS